MVTVNGQPLEGLSYGQVVNIIKATHGSLELTVVPKEDDILQIVSPFHRKTNNRTENNKYLSLTQYFSEIAQNPETNQRSPAPSLPSSSHRSSLVSVSQATPVQIHPLASPLHPAFVPGNHPDKVYAVPAVVREEEPNPNQLSDESAISRIRREFELKQEFLNRPTAAFHPQQSPLQQPSAPSKKEFSIRADVHGGDISGKNFSTLRLNFFAFIFRTWQPKNQKIRWKKLKTS